MVFCSDFMTEIIKFRFRPHRHSYRSYLKLLVNVGVILASIYEKFFMEMPACIYKMSLHFHYQCKTFLKRQNNFERNTKRLILLCMMQIANANSVTMNRI